jgi:hypothetical protein
MSAFSKYRLRTRRTSEKPTIKQNDHPTYCALTNIWMRKHESGLSINR